MHHDQELAEDARYARIFGVGVIILVLEVVGGWASGSLSLLSDAGHVGVDLAALSSGIWVARRIRLSKSKAPRLRELTAYFHGLLLFAISASILVEAYERLSEPHSVQSTAILVIAVIGFCGNVLQYRLSGRAENLTHQGINWHILSDMLQSAAVIVCAIAIKVTSVASIDAFTSAVLAIWLFAGGLWLIVLGRNGNAHSHHHSSHS